MPLSYFYQSSVYSLSSLSFVFFLSFPSLIFFLSSFLFLFSLFPFLSPFLPFPIFFSLSRFLVSRRYSAPDPCSLSLPPHWLRSCKQNNLVKWYHLYKQHTYWKKSARTANISTGPQATGLATRLKSFNTFYNMFVKYFGWFSCRKSKIFGNGPVVNKRFGKSFNNFGSFFFLYIPSYNNPKLHII